MWCKVATVLPFFQGRIVAFASIALAILALISLITALIINSLAINYVRSRFSNKIDQFNADPDARDVVNKIQTKYTCCGVDTWLDWSRVSLNATGSGTDNATTVTSTTSTTTTTSTTVLDSSTTAITVAPTETTTVARVARGWLASGSQEISKRSDDYHGMLDSVLLAYRKKRQDQASYGGFAGLPLSYAVTLPQSCCSTEVANTNDLNNLCKLQFLDAVDIPKSPIELCSWRLCIQREWCRQLIPYRWLW